MSLSAEGTQKCKLIVDRCQRNAYTGSMIKNFLSKALKKFAATGDASKLPVQGSAAIDRLTDQIVVLDTATAADQMNFPGWYFHQLRGNPVRYSVRVTANYRLTFGFEEVDAIDVDLEDYH